MESHVWCLRQRKIDTMSREDCMQVTSQREGCFLRGALAKVGKETNDKSCRRHKRKRNVFWTPDDVSSSHILCHFNRSPKGSFDCFDASLRLQLYSFSVRVPEDEERRGRDSHHNYISCCCSFFQQINLFVLIRTFASLLSLSFSFYLMSCPSLLLLSNSIRTSCGSSS